MLRIDLRQKGTTGVTGPRADLERRLIEMDGVTISPWKDTDLICLFHHGKEFAHFHGETILDIRLSPRIIRQENLPRTVSARIHPNRSPNSRWICVAFDSASEVDELLRIIERALKET